MEYKIEKNVPMAPLSTQVGRRTAWPFMDMEPGDSVFIPGRGTAPGNDAYAAARYAARKTGRKMTGRTVVENGVSGLRVWCLE